jgi:hypothetical protein
MPPGRKPNKGSVSQIHFIIPDDVQDYMARMGPMDPTSKIRCLLRKAIKDRIPQTIPELKAKLIELERARRGIGITIHQCTSRLVDLGEDEEKIWDEITELLSKDQVPD